MVDTEFKQSAQKLEKEFASLEAKLKGSNRETFSLIVGDRFVEDFHLIAGIYDCMVSYGRITPQDKNELEGICGYLHQANRLLDDAQEKARIWGEKEKAKDKEYLDTHRNPFSGDSYFSPLHQLRVGISRVIAGALVDKHNEKNPEDKIELYFKDIYSCTEGDEVPTFTWAYKVMREVIEKAKPKLQEWGESKERLKIAQDVFEGSYLWTGTRLDNDSDSFGVLNKFREQMPPDSKESKAGFLTWLQLWLRDSPYFRSREYSKGLD